MPVLKDWHFLIFYVLGNILFSFDKKGDAHMNIKRILSTVLTIVLLISLCACGKNIDTPPHGTSTTTPSTTTPEIPQNPEIPIKNVGFSEFDNELIAFLENDMNYNDNFMVSPLSYKYALVLATLGANGDTQTELLKALGFNSVDECLKWAEDYTSVLIKFEEDAIRDANYFNKNKEQKPAERMLNVANSIWHNTDRNGTISDEYIKLVNEKLSAQAYNEKGEDLMPKINGWVNEKTNGLIDKLFSKPLTKKNTILVNALYLKSAWMNSFDEDATKEDNFTTISGNIVKKDFMTTTEYFKYYKDNETEIVILPLDGGVYCTIVLGSTENIYEKIKEAKSTNIKLYVPKFEIESSFDKGELRTFLSNRGANLCMNQELADFSNMIDIPIFIDDIIQKTKIKTDENGLEAAAVTAITMSDNCVMPEDKPIEVRIDKAFKFFIYNYNIDETPELMFYGNYMK